MGSLRRELSILTHGRVGKQLCKLFTANGLESIPVDTFSLWGLVRDGLDTRPESSHLPEKQPQTMEENLKRTVERNESLLPVGEQEGEVGGSKEPLLTE